jgi:hypothetical protein
VGRSSQSIARQEESDTGAGSVGIMTATKNQTPVILQWSDADIGDKTVREFVADLERRLGPSVSLRLPAGPAVLEVKSDSSRSEELAVDLFMATMAKAGSCGRSPDALGMALACMVGLVEELLDLRNFVVDAPPDTKPTADRMQAHRRELVEALGLDDADAIYLWEDLLASVRGMVTIAEAAVAGLERPEDEHFNPWALRMVESRVGMLRLYEQQLEDAAEIMPCQVSSCEGNWVHMPGVALSPSDADADEPPLDRMCDDCRTQRGAPGRDPRRAAPTELLTIAGVGQ